MRRSTIIVTCVLLVAALVSPGVAMAKGGNGRHSVEGPEKAANGKAQAGTESASAATAEASENGKAKTKKSDAGKKPAATSKPKAASPQKSTTAKKAEKASREAPLTEAKAKAEQPVIATTEPPASVTLSAKSVSASPPSADLTEDRVVPDAIDPDGIETRGVLDTIRVKANATLEHLRATMTGVWTAVTSWVGR